MKIRTTKKSGNLYYVVYDVYKAAGLIFSPSALEKIQELGGKVCSMHISNAGKLKCVSAQGMMILLSYIKEELMYNTTGIFEIACENIIGRLPEEIQGYWKFHIEMISQQDSLEYELQLIARYNFNQDIKKYVMAKADDAGLDGVARSAMFESMYIWTYKAFAKYCGVDLPALANGYASKEIGPLDVALKLNKMHSLLGFVRNQIKNN